MISKLLGETYWEELDSFIEKLSSVYGIEEVNYFPERFKNPGRPKAGELEAEVLCSILSYFIGEEESNLYLSDLNNKIIKDSFSGSPKVAIKSLHFDRCNVLEEVKKVLINNDLPLMYTDQLTGFNSDYHLITDYFNQEDGTGSGYDTPPECIALQNRLREEQNMQVVFDTLKEVSVKRAKLSSYWKLL